MICDYKEHNYYGKGFKIQIIIHDDMRKMLLATRNIKYFQSIIYFNLITNISAII